MLKEGIGADIIRVVTGLTENELNDLLKRKV